MDPHDLRPFSLTYVVYGRDDTVGYALAALTLTPIFLVVAYVTLALSRRDLTTLVLGVGQALNEVLNFGLKRIIREARPTEVHTYAPKYGMPSNHSQFMAFWAVYIMLWMWFRWSHQGKLWKVMASIFASSLAGLVMYSRVYLGYHSILQVLVGCLVGGAVAILWYIFSEAYLRPHYAAIAKWRVCQYFLVRDTSAVGDVLSLEYRAVLAANKHA
jgi:dolichyldiphosphatase